MKWNSRHNELTCLGFRFLESGVCGCNDFYYCDEVIIQKQKCREGGTIRHIRCPWMSYINNKEHEVDYGIGVIRDRRNGT